MSANFPRSSLEPEVILLRHLARHPHALVTALSSHERGYPSRKSFTDGHVPRLVFSDELDAAADRTDQ